jgi:selenocysteine-specific elongation factor
MRHLVIGTAGHIDHGKSALVRALTGTDPDRLKEERARGITIDLGFAHLEVDATSVAFVDVPGHERFVKNMLAGATGIDGVVLVVAADESVMPQTREHFDICRLLRVETGIVALTKADLVDAETIDLVALEVRELVAGSFLEGAPIVAVSSRTGRGLEELREALRALAGRLRDRDPAGPTRLAIDRVFSVRGFGSVVTGTLASGVIRVDDELELWPSGRGVKVRGLQGHGVAIDEAGPGQRVAVNLAGVEVGDIERGETLASPSTLSVTRRIDAAIEALPSARALRHGARVRFHHGTRELLGRVAVASAVGSQGGDLASAGLLAEVPPGGRASGRSVHPPGVLAPGHDRGRRRARSDAATNGDPDGGGPGAALAPRSGDRRVTPRG